MQLWTASKLGRLNFSIRRDLRFYAPLVETMDFMGIDPVTFARAATSSRVGRDGLTHSIGANVPQFNFSGDFPLGLWMMAGQTVQYSPANGLDDVSTLVWIENDVPKSTPTNVNPFNSSGVWAGNLNVSLKHIVKANRVLAISEIQAIQAAVADVVQEIEVPAPPTYEAGVFFSQTPSGARNGTNKIFTLSLDPDPQSLLVFCFGVGPLEKVAAAPTALQFTVGGAGNRTITLGLGPTTDYPFVIHGVTA